MKKNLFILFVAILPFLASSCKKPEANFIFSISSDGTKVYTENKSLNADWYSWSLWKSSYIITNSDLQNPVFDIPESGEYKLVLEVGNKKNRNDVVEKSFSVTVTSGGSGGSGNSGGSGGGSGNQSTPPTASFNMNSTNGTYAPTTIRCTNTSSNAVRYQWTLTQPDYSSIISSSTNPSFTCNQAGTYTLKLIAYNSDNLSSTTSQTFTLISPSTYKITSLTLQKIPMTDTDNSSWDTGLMGGADPDIFFKILNSSNSVLYTSATKNNVASSSFPITWYSINKTLNYSENYIIRFYDEDGDLDPNDLMASCNFNSSYLTPGSSSYTWVASNGTIKFTVGLTWSRGQYGDPEPESQEIDETDAIAEE